MEQSFIEAHGFLRCSLKIFNLSCFKKNIYYSVLCSSDVLGDQAPELLSCASLST